MILDARSVPAGSQLEADVCVVGAGAAGITLARELARAGVAVCLLESGGESFEEPVQALYEGVNGGTVLDPASNYLAVTRLRYLGGSTNHWTGWCRPLDAIDFEPREWVEGSGWPFPREHLDPFYARAAPIVGVAPPDDEEDRRRGGAARPLLEGEEPAFRTSFFHVSAPVRFAAAYREELERIPGLRLLHHASLLELETDPQARRVERARVAAGAADRRLVVRARHFVLAAGGIETARLLLLSRGARKAGLGNDHDLVGRHFMDHPVTIAGRVVLPHRRAGMGLYRARRDEDRGHMTIGVIVPSAASQRRHRLQNLLFAFEPMENWRHGPHLRELGSIPLDLDRRATGALPSPLKSTYFGEVKIAAEHAPNPQSRVTLDDEKDALGQNRVRLDWRLRPADEASMRAAAELLARELGERALGRLKLLQDPQAPWRGVGWSSHHMGTARMHADPRRGVVDEHARVHGVANLHVAGSAVFPTSGCSNPTWTLVALALRLADRLREALGR